MPLCPSLEVPEVRLPVEMLWGYPLPHTQHKPALQCPVSTPVPEETRNIWPREHISLLRTLGTAGFFLFESPGHHPAGHFHGLSGISPAGGMSAAVLQPPSEPYQWRGKMQEVLGLGEVTQRTKAADKKKSHPRGSAGNDHPREDKLLGMSLPPLPRAPQPSKLPARGGFTAL